MNELGVLILDKEDWLLPESGPGRAWDGCCWDLSWWRNDNGSGKGDGRAGNTNGNGSGWGALRCGNGILR